MTEDGADYVECSTCGHALEQHGVYGCHMVEDCPCRDKWTVAEIRRARIDAGLTARRVD